MGVRSLSYVVLSPFFRDELVCAGAGRGKIWAEVI
jgi:hypothetical protein